MKRLFARLFLACIFQSLVIVPPEVQGRLLPPPVSPETYERAQVAGAIPVLVHFEVPAPSHQSSASLRQQIIQETRVSILQRIADPGIVIRAESDLWDLPLLALSVTPAALRILEQTPGITLIQEQLPGYPSLNSSSAAMDALQAYDLGVIGTDWVVAVLDTGISPTHPMLLTRVVAEACFSSPIPSDSLCPNGQAVQLGNGASSANKCRGLNTCGHGTTLSAIVAGATYNFNGTSYRGVAYGARIFSIQIYERTSDPNLCPHGAPCLVYYPDNLINALRHIYNERNNLNIAAVLFSGNEKVTKDTVNRCPKDILRAPVKQLYKVGIATIFPSGNNSKRKKIAYPACVPEAIVVGAAHDDTAIEVTSNSAQELELLAPGGLITSASGAFEMSTDTGTSLAAAHVAAAWAMLKQVEPSAPVDVILGALQATGQPILDSRNGFTHPFIQVGKAALALQNGTPSSGNLLSNPGFELNNAPGSGWVLTGSGASQICEYTGSNKVHEGLCAAELKATGTTSKIYQTLNVVPAKGTYLWLGAYVQTLNAKGAIVITLKPATGARSKLKLNLLGNHSYQLRSGTLSLSNQPYQIKLVLRMGKNDSGTIYMDDLVFELRNFKQTFGTRTPPFISDS